MNGTSPTVTLLLRRFERESLELHRFAVISWCWLAWTRGAKHI